jgi:tRNA(fMet)-specific endonuclease VapC
MAIVLQALAPFQSFAFDDEAAAIYARLRHELELAGSVIGPFDLQIAAISLRVGATLVTNNTSEFSRVAALPVENWML